MSKKREPVDALYDEAAEYLKANGWNVVVIGGTKVVRPDPARKQFFHFVIEFTGTEPPASR